MSERRKDALLALAIVLAVVAFHFQAARPGMALVGSDLRHFFFAMREALVRSLRAGHLPWWQRGLFFGFPFVADPQIGLFDFSTWLTLPWDAPRALTLATLLHLVVAGWGMAAWMRLRGLARGEALLAAILFALGAKETAHLLHWNFAASTAWWPWMLAGLDGFAERGRGRFVALTAIASALSWFGGSPQMAYFGTLVAGAYALALAPRLWRRSRADALLALAAAPFGFLLAAPLVLPVAQLARWGPRGAGVTYGFCTSWKWPSRWDLALLVVPRAFGGGRHYHGPLNLWEMTAYLGVLPLALAAAAPLRRKGTWLFAALGVLGLWLGFGEDAWLGLHRFFYDFLPGFGSFRNPTRTAMVTSLCSALLAAEAVHALRRDFGVRARRAAVALGALALLAPLLLLAWEPAGFDVPAACASALATSGLALLALLWLRSPARGRAFALAACALCFLDGRLSYGDADAVAPARFERPVLADFARFVPPPGGPRRVAVDARWGKVTNDPVREGWEAATGYGPTLIGRVRTLLEATHTDHVGPVPPAEGDQDFPRPRFTSRLWPLFATPLVVSDERIDLPELAHAPPEWDDALRAYLAPALPRVYWVGGFEVADDAHAAGAMLRAAQGDRAVLAEKPDFTAGGPGGPVAASEVKLGATTLSATVVAPRDGLAVVVDPFFPGWSARVDGAPAELVRANYAFEAVPVKAGRHALTLSYVNVALPMGAVLASGALALMLVVLSWRRRQRPVAAEAAGDLSVERRRQIRSG